MNTISTSPKFKLCKSATSQLPYFKFTGALEQSSNDYRTHALLRLSNNLVVVCTQDDSVEKATVALSVNVGSYSDPVDMPGLAYCLEHSLFLDQDGFSRCLNQNNGTYSVSGGGSYTNYSFTVGNDVLEDCVERFAQLFIHPQFKDVKLNCAECGLFGTRRFLQAFSKPDEHVGYNASSLDSFYNTYYSANVMKLVITGNYSLNQLINWAVEKFSGIPDKGIALPVFEAHPFANSCIGKVAKIESADCGNKIDLVFATPGTSDKYASSPSYYASCILSEKVRGSLLHYLKTNGWATGFDVIKHHDENNGFSLFNLSILATSDGIQNYEQVIMLTMGYLDKISGKLPKKWIHNKYHDACTIEYNYIHSDEGVSWCVELANDLHNTNLLPEHVLSRNRLVRIFSPEASLDYFTQINSANYSVILYTQNTEINTTERSLIDLPSSLTTNVSVADNIMYKFFLPDRFDKKSQAKPKYKKKSNSETKVAPKSPSGPRLLVKNNNVEVWFNRNDAIYTSRGTIIAEIQLPKSSNSPQNIALIELFCQYANAAIGDELYQTPARGCKFTVSRGESSIVIFIDWFSEKLVGVLNKIIYTLTTVAIEDAYFETYRSSLINEYNDKLDKEPHQIAEYYEAYVAQDPIWRPSDIVDALKAIDPPMLRSFTKSMFASTYTKMIVSGYVNEIYAYAGARIVKAKLKSMPLLPSEQPRVYTCQFEPGHFVFKLPAGTSNSVVSGVSSYIYCGQQSEIRDKALCHILSRIINSSNQHSREKKEYFIRASCLPFIHARCILALTIQGVDNPAYLTMCLNIMLEKLRMTLIEMEEEEYEDHADALIERLLENTNMNSTETRKLWEKIYDCTYDFYENSKMAREISTLTKSDIIEFWDKYIVPKTATDYSRTDCQIWSSQIYQPTDEEVVMYKFSIISLHGCLYRLGITDISISALSKIMRSMDIRSNVTADALAKSIIDACKGTPAAESILADALDSLNSAVKRAVEIAIDEANQQQPAKSLSADAPTSTQANMCRTIGGIWHSSNITKFKQALIFNEYPVPVKEYTPEVSEI